MTGTEAVTDTTRYVLIKYKQFFQAIKQVNELSLNVTRTPEETKSSPPLQHSKPKKI